MTSNASSVSNETANRSDLTEEEGIFYQAGFGNTFESECLPGALPKGRNNPRQVPYNLYAEQLSGTAFTAPRAHNQRVWLYRIQPSVVVGNCCAEDDKNNKSLGYFGGCDPQTCQTTVDPLRWKPLKHHPTTPASHSQDFIDGTRLVCSAGDASAKSGLAMYVYACGKSMDSNRHFYNADGDFLIVPQQGALEIATEVGRLRIRPTQIAVIPRGMVFQIQLLEQEDASITAARGYLLEVYNGNFQLPELGPIGSNGLVNARDVQYPTASCCATRETYQQEATIILCKMHSKLFSKPTTHSPYNVVAWHGNYLPFRYDLARFCAVNSVTYDHLDPSIYTVLSCPSPTTGTALADFVVFPHRVMATDSNTLRPPWFHRNTMSEFMGLIQGEYDAKSGEGFVPGGASLHNCMTPHGPDTESYEKGVQDECRKPNKFEGGWAFMFETCLSLKVAPQALEDETWRDVEYTECWQGLSADKFTGWDLLSNQKE